uniref:Uncharacterized protein n=1 Tax=Arundo donax TaxID=35708 RepID=A0A0A9EFY5_ARUDO
MAISANLYLQRNPIGTRKPNFRDI